MKKIKIRICSEPSETSPTGKLYYFEFLEKIWFLQKWIKPSNYDVVVGYTKEELVEKTSSFERMSIPYDIVDPDFVHERKLCYPVKENRWHINLG